jgi:hypothetical protein
MKHTSISRRLRVYLTISMSFEQFLGTKPENTKKRGITTNLHHKIIQNIGMRQTTLEGSRKHQSKGEAKQPLGGASRPHLPGRPASHEGNPLPPSGMFLHRL